MPEIIDLLSSSPEPGLPPPQRGPSKNTEREKPFREDGKASLGDGHLRGGGDSRIGVDDGSDWFQLSSDGGNLTSQMAKSSVSVKESTNTSTKGNMDGKRKADSALGTTNQSTSTSISTDIHKLDSSVRKGGKDFLYGFREDDFDSTVMLDDGEDVLGGWVGERKRESSSSNGVKRKARDDTTKTNTNVAKVISLDDDDEDGPCASPPPVEKKISSSSSSRVVGGGKGKEKERNGLGKTKLNKDATKVSSFEDEDDVFASSPPSKKVRLSSSPKNTEIGKGKIGLGTTKRNSNPTKSYNFDDEDNPFASSSPPSKKLWLSSSPKPVTLPKPKSSISLNTTKPNTNISKPNNTTKGKDLVHGFRDDDFDSTVVLDDDDDPFAFLISPKKRCLSSSPRQLPAPRPKSSGFNRSISNIEGSSNANSSWGPSIGALRRNRVLEEDPIVFTSSPDPVAEQAKKKRDQEKEDKKRRLRELEEERERLMKEVGDDSGSGSSRNRRAKRKRKAFNTSRNGKVSSFGFELSDSDDDILSEGNSRNLKKKPDSNPRKKKSDSSFGMDFDEFSPDEDGKPKPKPKPKLSQFGLEDLSDDSDLLLSDLDAHSKKTSKAKAKPKTIKNSQTAEEKQKAKDKTKEEREQKAKDKVAAKEAEKERKALAKEEKVREKARAEAVAKVNTKKTDKKVSSPEMIVDIPTSLDPKVVSQTLPFLEKFDIQHTEWESDLPVVKWRRKVSSKFNPDEDIWEPCDLHIKAEDHIMCILRATEFVKLATGEEGHDLDSHVIKLKRKFQSCKIIYLIEGLHPWMNKNKALKNREFVAAVRSHLPESQKSRKEKGVYVDEEKIEDALLKLQVHHETLIHHAAVPIETAEWISVFTQHISTIPYRTQTSSLNTTFCMESGQVKTGADASDTFTKMLQEMTRITAPVAYGIAAKYPTVQQLVRGLREDGPTALEECRKSANKDGAFSNKKVGPSVSKRVWKVFLGRDEGSWEV